MSHESRSALKGLILLALPLEQMNVHVEWHWYEIQLCIVVEWCRCRLDNTGEC